MNSLLTIIIPVYRVSDTIDRCVESIVKQKYSPMEIILVDDGSPDECPQICDRWALRDKRISVIHKVNGGLSSARNAGIDKAKGEYITFVDSDDYIENGTIPELMRIICRHPEYDILEYPVYKAFGSEEQIVLNFGNVTYCDTDDYWMSCKAYEHSYAWNKIYRRTMFDGVRFPVGKVFEDIHTLPRILNNAKIVATTDKGLYYYVKNSEGITMKARGPEWRMLLDAHLKVIYRYTGHPLFHQYYMQVVNIQIQTHILTGDTPRLERHHISSLKGLDLKTALKAIAINLLGINILCALYRMISRTAGLRW